MKFFSMFSTLLFVLALTMPVCAQNFEVNGGWVHATGDFGLDGLEVGGAIWFTRNISVAVNYDAAWDTSRLGTLDLVTLGVPSVKSHMQNFMIGPRYFFPRVREGKLQPFAEAQFGGSHLSTSAGATASSNSLSSSDSAFTWMFGGGVDYNLGNHFALRGNLDLMRTHFVESGQTRLRFVLGVAYTLGKRK
jgi:hypothetical protein